jgi:hypothetical protein
MATQDEMKRALVVAASALRIASDWNLPDVQVHPPTEWGLEAQDEDPSDGWCSTAALADYLDSLAL